MNTHNGLSLTLLSVLILAGCATATPYQQGGENRPGYRDVKLEGNKYRVSFEGNSSTPQETVQNYLLYRASEIALNGGYDYFIVSDEEGMSKIEGSSGPAFSTGLGFGGRRSFSSVGLGYGNATIEQQYKSTAYVAAYKGKVPEDNPRAYDARELQKNLGDKIVRPKGK